MILVGLVVLSNGISIAKASGMIPTIYIRADGTVDPYDAPIQRKGASYVIVSDIASDGDGIVFQKSNIMIEGNGHQILGKGNGTGITLDNVNNVTVKDLDIQDFLTGILLNSSSSNVISEDTITDNGNGITIISNSGKNAIIEDEVFNNQNTGISLNYSSNNEIEKNRIENNSYGINIQELCNGTYMTENNITTNAICGVNVDRGTQTIYHNSFLENAQNAKTYSSTSMWDNGIEGNFWSNYGGRDLNLDGIGDAAYVIDGNNHDNYPLMGTFHHYVVDGWPYEFSIVTNSTVEGYSYSGPGYPFYVKTLEISVSNTTANQTFGFARICIPHEMLDLNEAMTLIDGGAPYCANYTVYDNGTHTWVYLAYEYPAHLISISPEFAPLIALPLFVTATMLAVMIHRKKLSKTRTAQSLKRQGL
jgi:parallel beta-helix repeat protein